jgi:hypothetical protein
MIASGPCQNHVGFTLIAAVRHNGNLSAGAVGMITKNTSRRAAIRYSYIDIGRSVREHRSLSPLACAESHISKGFI